ncbi:hypothetical protein AAGS61_07320 [Lysinibacillus sp. KU-BSD001]|uniref:hypothetical protein n=1 Tax=Lysinibacillus sp. KU-BSD001 TaxID=3141328 RepID=UPI0036E8791D
MKYVYFLLCSLFLAACTQVAENVSLPDSNEHFNEKEYKNAFEHSTALQLFFKEDQTTAGFLGEGNEYASFTEETIWLTDTIVQTVVDNGGVTMYRIYRIADQAIDLVYEDVTSPNLTVDEIEKLPTIELYMALPIERNTSFDGWVITAIDVTVKTPFQTFTQAIEVVKETDDFKTSRYFVRGFGLVKQIDEMKMADGVFVVSSTLKEIQYHSN